MNPEDQEISPGGALDLDALDGLLVAPGWSPRRVATADPGPARVREDEPSDPLHVAPPPVELELPRAPVAASTRPGPSRRPPRVVMSLEPAPVAEVAPVASVEAAVAPPVAAPPARGTPWLVPVLAAVGLAGLVLIAMIVQPEAQPTAVTPAPAPAPVAPAAPSLAAALAVAPAAPAAEAPPPSDWVLRFGYNQTAPEPGLTPPVALLACAGLEITGYTCDRGDSASNLRLGQARADAVAGLLVAAGYPAERVRARSAGAADPVADNQSAAGRRENRRVRVRCLLEPTQPSTGPE